MPQEVDVLPVFLRDRLYLRVSPPEDMLPPLLIVEGCQFDPTLEVLILTLDNALLPLLVSADVVVLVETVMTMGFGLLASGERGLLGFK